MKIIPRTSYTLSLSPEHPAIAEVAPGEKFGVECAFAKGGILQADGTSSAPLAGNEANPMNGPVHVKGITAGEWIAVTIHKMVPVGYGQSCGLSYRPIDGAIEFLEGLRVPADPSIGCIGAAPKLKEEATGNSTCGAHGGNLDCRDAGPGATVFIRARVAGANLGFGDVHWAMGDGELNGTGVEGAADAVLTVRKARSAGIEWPWIVRNGLVMTMGGAPDLRTAQRIAYEEMMTLCRTLLNLERREVQGRITVAGDLKVCQSVCSLITVRLCLPLELLGTPEKDFLAKTII